jgi:B-box zinc finger
VFCLECNQNMCNSCSEVHSQLSMCRDHTAVKLEELSSVDTMYAKYQSTVCDRHKNEPVKIYCYDCETAVCMMCYVKDHNLHKCSDVEEAAEEFRAALMKDVQIIRNALNRFDKTLKVLDSKRGNFQDEVKKAEDAICKRADELKTKIEVDKQNLMAELNDIESSRHKQIDKVVRELAQEKSLVERLNAYCDELSKKGAASELSHQAGNLRTQVTELANVRKDAETMEKLGSVDVKFLPSRCWTSECDNNLVGQIVKSEDSRGR